MSSNSPHVSDEFILCAGLFVFRRSSEINVEYLSIHGADKISIEYILDFIELIFAMIENQLQTNKKLVFVGSQNIISFNLILLYVCHSIRISANVNNSTCYVYHQKNTGFPDYSDFCFIIEDQIQKHLVSIVSDLLLLSRLIISSNQKVLYKRALLVIISFCPENSHIRLDFNYS